MYSVKKSIIKMKLLYIDAINSGISGDMFLASLLGLVPDSDTLLNELKSLKDYLPGVSKLQIELVNITRSGIKLNKLKIDIKENKHHRTANVLKISLNKFLEDNNLTNEAKNYANNVLNTLIQAEAEIHGELIENLHLHELSSIDTLIDIIGVSRALETIGAFNNNFKIFCSKLPLGGGTIKTAHGILPIPAPATLKILEKSNLVGYNGPIENELVTPTGAALLANLNTINFPCEARLKKVIYSTGQKEFNNFLNILRLYYGEMEEEEILIESHPLKDYIEPITVLETNVDDVSGEILGNFIKKLEEEDILDIQIIPSITKKNRPSHNIKVLCQPEYKFKIIEKFLYELGTLGVRFNTISRVCVERKIENTDIEINGKIYDLRYKISYIDTKKERKIVNIKPENEDLRRIAEDSGLSLKEILFFTQAKREHFFYKYKKNNN
ncbi:MAG: nickel pincer cofactor biosynthesis protein LarC [Promethearchaeota archaeon]|nr:MAG: nickel pincer cofactor biosynthesis protein LarC [Candidatus Lokiarchaeota archaeon]